MILLFPLRIVRQKSLPAGVAFSVGDAATLKVMTERRSQTVCRIQLFGKVGGLDFQHGAKHGGNLLFARRAVACD